MKIFFKKYVQNEKGYTLLFAVLVASVVLGIGISILNISKKEFLIATSARDSSAAFYAADSGLECAIYSDSKDAFNTATNKTVPFPCGIRSSFGTPLPAFAPGNQEGVFTVHMKFGEEGNSCAVVTVTKQIISSRVYTIIDSRGYNTGWSESLNTCNQTSAKRVERGIRYSY